MHMNEPDAVLPITIVKSQLKLSTFLYRANVSNVWTQYWAEKLSSYEDKGSTGSSTWQTLSEVANERSETKERCGGSNSTSPKPGVWSVLTSVRKGCKSPVIIRWLSLPLGNTIFTPPLPESRTAIVSTAPLGSLGFLSGARVQHYLQETEWLH